MKRVVGLLCLGFSMLSSSGAFAGRGEKSFKVIEGDILLPESQTAFWASLVKQPQSRVGRTTDLIVNTLRDNVIDVWSTSMRNNLSYCVSNDFGALKPRVLEAIEEAMREWESSAGVTFIYKSEEDSQCDSSNERVVFNIASSAGEAFLAAAFFPSYPRSDRQLVVDQSAFSFDARGLAGIFRHELGHVLGFRHEHVHPQSNGVCSEGSQFKPLTEYDRRSVMHYPQCGGENDIYNLTLTNFDRQGAALVYPQTR